MPTRSMAGGQAWPRSLGPPPGDTVEGRPESWLAAGARGDEGRGRLGGLAPRRAAGADEVAKQAVRLAGEHPRVGRPLGLENALPSFTGLN